MNYERKSVEPFVEYKHGEIRATEYKDNIGHR